MEGSFKVAKKVGGKWKTLGNIKLNKFGNMELGLRNSDELREAITAVEPGKWINLSIFPDKKDEVSTDSAADIGADTIPY